MKSNLIETLTESGITLSVEGQAKLKDLFEAAVAEETSKAVAVEIQKFDGINESHRQELEEKTKTVLRKALTEWTEAQASKSKKLDEATKTGLSGVDDVLENLQSVIKVNFKAIEKELPTGDSLSNWKKFKQAVEDASKFFDMVDMNESTDEVAELKKSLQAALSLNEELLAKVPKEKRKVVLMENEQALSDALKTKIVAMLESDEALAYEAAVLAVTNEAAEEEAKAKKEAEDKASKEAEDKKAEEDAAEAKKLEEQAKADADKKPKTLQEQTLEFIKTGKRSALIA